MDAMTYNVRIRQVDNDGGLAARYSVQVRDDEGHNAGTFEVNRQPWESTTVYSLAMDAIAAAGWKVSGGWTTGEYVIAAPVEPARVTV